MPTIDQTELGYLYPIESLTAETVTAETEKPEPEAKKKQEMEKSTEPETKKPDIQREPEADIKDLETENLLSETEKSTEPETKRPEMKQRPSTLSYSQPMNAPVIDCSSTSLEQIIVQVSFHY